MGELYFDLESWIHEYLLLLRLFAVCKIQIGVSHIMPMILVLSLI